MSSNIEADLSVKSWDIHYESDGAWIAVKTESGHIFEMHIVDFVDLANNCLGMEHFLDTGERWEELDEMPKTRDGHDCYNI